MGQDEDGALTRPSSVSKECLGLKLNQPESLQERSLNAMLTKQVIVTGTDSAWARSAPSWNGHFCYADLSKHTKRRRLQVIGAVASLFDEKKALLDDDLDAAVLRLADVVAGRHQ